MEVRIFGQKKAEVGGGVACDVFPFDLIKFCACKLKSNLSELGGREGNASP